VARPVTENLPAEKYVVQNFQWKSKVKALLI